MSRRKYLKQPDPVDHSTVHESLKGGYVNKIEYDFNLRHGIIYFEQGCGDMGSCIKFFESLDDKVQAIFTYDAGKPDTSYRRESDKWVLGDFRN